MCAAAATMQAWSRAAKAYLAELAGAPWDERVPISEDTMYLRPRRTATRRRVHERRTGDAHTLCGEALLLHDAPVLLDVKLGDVELLGKQRDLRGQAGVVR